VRPNLQGGQCRFGQNPNLNSFVFRQLVLLVYLEFREIFERQNRYLKEDQRVSKIVELSQDH
jgi:hypothetical protein